MAEQLGAPPRAVYRDLDVLQQLEVPLYTDKTAGRAWKLDPDYRNRLSIAFTLSEVLSVYFAQIPSGRWREPSSTILCSRSLKTSGRFLPKPLFRQMANLRGSFLSGIPAQKDYGTYREFIKLIQEAHRRTKGWQVLYQPRDQSPAERRMSLRVHLHNGSLYVIGIL
jgi:predicted DNA-binding transcriptional regulator YafY